MELNQKTKFSIILIAACFITSTTSLVLKHACTLDEIKLYAAEACEELFLNNHGNIHKREISNNGINAADNDPHNIHQLHKHQHLAKVWKNTFPSIAYLILNVEHAKSLAEKNPKYKWKHMHSVKKINKSMDLKRDKRQSEQVKTHIAYCCSTQCRSDYFCS